MRETLITVFVVVLGLFVLAPMFILPCRALHKARKRRAEEAAYRRMCEKSQELQVMPNEKPW